MPMTNPTGAANIRAELARADVSQAAIAELLELAPSQISARVKGRIPWRLHELQAIARHLGIPVSVLVDEPAASSGSSVAS